MKFGVGQPVRRFEDQTLITGKGRYTDDITLPNMAQAVVVRAQAAHANIRRIDATAARAMPGVLLVLTGEDVTADGLGDIPCHAPLNNRDGTPRHDTPRPALAIGKVRHVGQPVALVVAETLAAGAGRRRGDRDRLRDAARRRPTRAPRSSQARRSCSTASRATWCSTGTTTPPTSPRPTRPSPRPRTSPRWRWSTTAWW